MFPWNLRPGARGRLRPGAKARARPAREPPTVWQIDEDRVLAQVLQDLHAQLDVQHARLEHGVQVVTNVLDALALEAGRALALVRPAQPRAGDAQAGGTTDRQRSVPRFRARHAACAAALSAPVRHAICLFFFSFHQLR